MSSGMLSGSMDGGKRLAELTLDGVSQLLEVLHAIIQGYRRPLSESHLEMLWGCLLPLHANTAMVDDTNPVLSLYHKPLIRCVCGYLDKDTAITAGLLEQLVGCWPTSMSANSGMEVLLLHAVEAVIESADPQTLANQAICDTVFQKVAHCYSLSTQYWFTIQVAQCIRADKNFRVAERALTMFQSDQVLHISLTPPSYLSMFQSNRVRCISHSCHYYI